VPAAAATPAFVATRDETLRASARSAARARLRDNAATRFAPITLLRAARNGAPQSAELDTTNVPARATSRSAPATCVGRVLAGIGLRR
jgi:hypothetical protein